MYVTIVTTPYYVMFSQYLEVCYEGQGALLSWFYLKDICVASVLDIRAFNFSAKVTSNPQIFEERHDRRQASDVTVVVVQVRDNNITDIRR